MNTSRVAPVFEYRIVGGGGAAAQPASVTMLRPIPKAVPARIALPPQTNCILHGENMKTTIVHWMAKLLGLAIRIDGLPTGLLARREPLQQVLSRQAP